VDLDESAVGGLSQWFHANRGEGGLDGVGMAAACTQSSGQALQCVQPCLTHPFSLVLQPVVVPVGQQIPDQIGQTYGIQIDSFGCGLRLAEAVGKCNQIADINIDAGIESEDRWGSNDHLPAGLANPPQRSAEVSERAFGRIVRPEYSGHTKPPDRAILESE
jgi:hypothetical protein